MARLAERALPVAAAAAAAVVTALAVSLLQPASAGGPVLTVRRLVPAGGEVPAGDLVRVPAAPAVLPHSAGPLYARVALSPGVPIEPGEVSAVRPRAYVSLGPGVVAENVTLPAAAVPAGAAPGHAVALAGTADGTSASQLLASDARVLAVSSLASGLGAPASDVVTLALPLPSALVVADAARAGTLALLPWRMPAAEAAR